jgi:RNA polymerase sigma-70 factor (ECF subfamily)
MKLLQRPFGRPTRSAAPGAERELVARLLARDANAFAALVRAQHESLVRLALVFVGNRATAEEVAQDAWARILAALPGFEGRSSLRTWMFSICANAARSRAQSEARTRPFSSLEAEAPIEADRFDASGHWDDPPRAWEADTPEAILERKEAVSCIERTLDELPAAQRAVVLLRDLEGVDAADACRILQVSESNQRVLLHRGRGKIRRALEKLLARG